jgi:predicted metal-dependent enzyme (double-stranded beta helix superfamily)
MRRVDTSGSLSYLVEALTAVFEGVPPLVPPDEAVSSAVVTALDEALEGPDLIPAAVGKRPPAGGYAKFLLHSCPHFIVYASVSAPDCLLPVHDHGTWGFVGMSSGVEEEIRFARVPVPEEGVADGSADAHADADADIDLESYSYGYRNGDRTLGPSFGHSDGNGGRYGYGHRLGFGYAGGFGMGNGNGDAGTIRPELIEVSRRVYYTGDIIKVPPPPDDVHRMTNRGALNSVAINVFGTDLVRAGFRLYEAPSYRPTETGPLEWDSMSVTAAP